MPSTPEAIRVFQEAKILYATGKAGAAGGIVFVKNVKNRQKIRAACPKQLWRTCGKRKKAENFAKKFAGGLDK